MGDNIKALTEVYVALGGNASDIPAGASNADIIALIATVASGGGGGGADLPAVTSEDNGDVLTVVDGAWGKAAPSGGGGVCVVHASLTWNDSTSGFDVTVEEQDSDIIAAITAGEIVEMHVGRYGNDPHTDFEVYPLLDAYTSDESNISMDFGFPLEAEFKTNNVDFKKASVSYYDGTWTYAETTKSLNAP